METSLYRQLCMMEAQRDSALQENKTLKVQLEQAQSAQNNLTRTVEGLRESHKLDVTTRQHRDKAINECKLFWDQCVQARQELDKSRQKFDQVRQECDLVWHELATEREALVQERSSHQNTRHQLHTAHLNLQKLQDRYVKNEQELVRRQQEQCDKDLAEAQQALATLSVEKERLLAESEQAKELMQQQLIALHQEKERLLAESEQAKELMQQQLIALHQEKERLLAESEQAKELMQQQLVALHQKKRLLAESEQTKELMHNELTALRGENYLCSEQQKQQAAVLQQQKECAIKKLVASQQEVKSLELQNSILAEKCKRVVKRECCSKCGEVSKLRKDNKKINRQMQELQSEMRAEKQKSLVQQKTNKALFEAEHRRTINNRLAVGRKKDELKKKKEELLEAQKQLWADQEQLRADQEQLTQDRGRLKRKN